MNSTVILPFFKATTPFNPVNSLAEGNNKVFVSTLKSTIAGSQYDSTCLSHDNSILIGLPEASISVPLNSVIIAPPAEGYEFNGVIITWSFSYTIDSISTVVHEDGLPI